MSHGENKLKCEASKNDLKRNQKHSTIGRETDKWKNFIVKSDRNQKQNKPKENNTKSKWKSTQFK